MSTQTRRLSAALAPLVLLAPTACSEESEPEGDTAEQSTHAVAVAADFFEPTPEWSAPVPEGARVFPLGEHLVWHSPETGSIGAYDASGAEVWSAELPSFGIVDEDDIEDDFRIVDERTVAVVRGGTTEPEGRDDSEVLYRTWLYDVASGPLGEPAEVSADGYHPSDYGLAFPAYDGEGEPTPLDPSFTVSASGEVTEHEPIEDTLAGTPVRQTPNLTVGGIPVLDIRGETEPYTSTPVEGDFHGGFGGEGWNSLDIAPPSAPSGGVAAKVLAAAGERYVTARWSEVGGDGSNDVVGLVDVSNGELVAELSCEGGSDPERFRAPPGGTLAVSSNGGYLATAGAVIGTESGEVRCAEADLGVVLHAVDDRGRAFGDIDADSEEADVIMLGADGEATTASSDAGAHAPLGFLEGGLAVHYDSGSGTVTANRIKV